MAGLINTTGVAGLLWDISAVEPEPALQHITAILNQANAMVDWLTVNYVAISRHK